MNKDEALKLALEALEMCEVPWTGTLDHNLTEAITAIKEALAQPEQEPVAWRTVDGEGGYEYRSYDMNEQYAQEWEQRNPKHKWWVEPLYTFPQPCPTCEALARTVMMDQTGRDA